jgi:hypothetical protein
MSVNINLSAKKEMNLASLKRRFPTVETIVYEASLVAVYRYKKRADKSKYWIKENLTGPLFVVQHTMTCADVEYSVIVLNQEGQRKLVLSTSFYLLIYNSI